MNDNIQILVLFGFLYVFPRISPVFHVGTVSPGNPGNSWCQETSQPPEVAEEVPGRCCRICLEDWDCGESGNLGICIASICTFIIYLSLKHMHTYAYSFGLHMATSWTCARACMKNVRAMRASKCAAKRASERRHNLWCAINARFLYAFIVYGKFGNGTDL